MENDFNQEVLDTKDAFVTVFKMFGDNSNGWKRFKVVTEDLIIMYDQMREKIEKMENDNFHAGIDRDFE